MAAQLLNLIQLKPTPVDRQTGERQTKLGKISQSCFSSVPSGCGRKFVRRDGRTAGDRFQLKAVLRVAVSAQDLVTSVVLRAADIFPEFFAILEAAKTDLGSIAVLDHAMPYPRWSVAIKLPGGG